MGFKRPEITASYGFLASLTVALLLVPIRWIVAWLAASVIHELGHILAIQVGGGSWTALRFGFNGMRIETQNISAKKEVLCAIAGPAAGITILIFSRWVPRVAVCAAIQTACNLIPLYPLDGGRVLTGVIHMLLPPHYASKTICIIEWMMLFLLGVAMIWLSWAFSLGTLLLVAYVVLLLKTGKIKFSCKRSREGVQ